MLGSTATRPTSHESVTAADTLETLRQQIEHAAHLLPAQGPITAFVHHNTLHAFEHLTFEDGVVEGGKTFGCHPYLPEDRFRKELARERIRVTDLESVLREDLKDAASEPLLTGTRLDLRLAMLRYPIRTGPHAELRWFVAESDALRTFREEVPASVRARMIEDTRHWFMRDLRNGSGKGAAVDRRVRDSVDRVLESFGNSAVEDWEDADWESFVLNLLWKACREGVQGVRSFADHPAAAIRHRDALLELTGTDSDVVVNDVLIRFCAAYADQGFADWTLADRERGSFEAFLGLYGESARLLPGWMQDAQRELGRIHAAGWGPLESIAESLKILGVSDEERESYLVATFLALRGWAGMIWQMETRSDRMARSATPGSLIGFLAIRLLLDRCALKALARETLDYRGPLDSFRQTVKPPEAMEDSTDVDQRAFLVFQVAQFLGWKPEDLFRLAKSDWAILISEIEQFSNLARRRVFHLAYERRYRNQALDAIGLRASHPITPPTTPQFQAVFCIDEREESFRRHLEEISPSVEAFGAAGFFGVAMYYRGADEAHYIPLCPIVVRPQHYVRERVVESFEDLHRRRALHRRVIGSASHRVHVGSRTFAGGALLTTLLGPLATIPLVARVLAPRLTGRIRRRAATFVQAPRNTQLQLQRSEPEAGPDGGHVGFTTDEMANVGERILRDMGFTSRFARIVIIVGHGSNSLNNPHKAAYDCGACAGSVGGPNARALAQILNDPRIRSALAGRSIEIPADTIFVGCWHNTCDEELTFYDLDRIPDSHRNDFSEALRLLEEACNRNAHERSRRFQSARLDMTFEEARRHVQERAEDLAQTRPELGHATNAITYVGRRCRTRGLFMDRRAFLTSYDPTQDTPDSAILTRILSAVVPVCAGINLEYYFSHVDNPGFGCGTKLPHNVASLLGVMEGPTSDLRTGLPWQMVEIHEPVRSLFVIETTPESMQNILDANPAIRVLIANRWVQLAVLDPGSGRLHRYHDGRFLLYQPESSELPSVATSPEWYRGWRDHLGFALVRNALRPWAAVQTRTAREAVR
jgi:uncharacterized protein YbcC (UPF0753/DUF2309 family)